MSAQNRRAAILPVVLFTVLLIALVGAVYGFRVHADVAATSVLGERMQSRLAAEAGVEWAKAFLRTGRFSRSTWYHNPDAFHRIVLWADGEDAKVTGTNDEFKAEAAYRFSLVADDPTDDETYIRFGMTDEASKLNLNAATDQQLMKLVSFVLADRDDVDPRAIVDAILDWRDTDSNPRGEAGDTEGIYYRELPKPYAVKNGPFDTVEELLLVKGITPDVLFGEDFDRNGLLTDNEDDGDLSFPPDNQDQLLNRGLYPYLTAISYENDVANNNRSRVYLMGSEQDLRAELELIFPDDPVAVDFIVAATRKPQQGGPGGPNGPNQPGGNEGEGGADGPGGDEGQDLPGGDQPGVEDGPGGPAGPDNAPDNRRPGGGRRGRPGTPGTPGQPQPGGGPGLPQGKLIGGGVVIEGTKLAAQAQLRGNQVSGGQISPTGNPPSDGDETPQEGLGDPTSGNPDTQEQEGDPQQGGQQPQGPGQNPGGPNGSGDGGPGTTPIRSPADLMLPRKIGQNVEPSPLGPEQLAVLMDRTTARKPEEKRIEGLININTAPRPVLECIDGLESEQIDAVVAARERLDDINLETPAWLVTEGILDVETFAKIAPGITARAQQFSIESLGYADHKGMVTRLQVVLDMMGPIPQTVYVRDLSYLGASFPIREKDLEQQRAR